MNEEYDFGGLTIPSSGKPHFNITVYGDFKTLDDVHKMKQKITMALNEYPKLEEINKQYKDLIIICDTLTNEGTRLKKENKKLNELLDEVGVLRGEDAIKFEEYNNRPATKKELDMLKEADRIYKMHDPEQIELTKLKQIKQRLDEEFTWWVNHGMEGQYDKSSILSLLTKIRDGEM